MISFQTQCSEIYPCNLSCPLHQGPKCFVLLSFKLRNFSYNRNITQYVLTQALLNRLNIPHLSVYHMNELGYWCLKILNMGIYNVGQLLQASIFRLDVSIITADSVKEVEMEPLDHFSTRDF